MLCVSHFLNCPHRIFNLASELPFVNISNNLAYVYFVINSNNHPHFMFKR